MRISYRWLARHVDLSGISAAQLANDLTLSTAEVEGVEPFAPQLSDVVVGLVAEHGRHPDAEKLSICSVDVGGAEPLAIVCGAPNVAAGQKVAVAQIGTVLPGDFKIKKSKIRGVESRGMICSVRELELGDEHDGIWVLPEDAVVGKSVAEALGIDDQVIEIDNKSLTHRPDLWGHRGIAGEVAAIYSRVLKPLDDSLPSTGTGKSYPIRVETPSCSRYLGLLIEGARAEKSPDWLRWLLLAVGQRPIDAIVDLSNFVMLDLGQPNHTFDATRLDATSSEGIVVRNARAGEKMTTLDGEPRALEASDLLICSGDVPVALAGIMGGEESKVGDDTQRLLLEVATFDAATVRRTSSRLGIRTDSSARFEKSLDPTLPLKAAGHFARLLREIQPDISLPAPISDAGEWTDPAVALQLRGPRVREALGAEVSDAEIVDILVRLGFEVEASAQEPGVFSVGVPSARSTKDVTIEQDLIEEVGRIYRYGNIPVQKIRADVVPPPFDPRRDLVRRIQDRLAGAARFHEALSYSFVSDQLIERTGQHQRPHVTVHNPMAQEEARVRRVVLPSLLATLEHNRRNRDDVRLFEIGKGYRPEEGSENGEPLEVHEAALVWASLPPAGKNADAYGGDRFSQLYGVVADLLEFLGMPKVEWTKASSPQPWNHPGRCLEGRFEGIQAPAAVVANIEPGLARALGLDDELASDVAVAEISIDTLLEVARTTRPFRPIPRFPGVKIDVAVDLPEEAIAADLVAAIEESGKGHVANVELFDVYRGNNVDTGRKSLAYHVLLQSGTKTLTDKDQARFLKKLEKNLERLDARLRK
jgi:phenylalanyl-tRNA synthetase beta chain